MVPWLVQVRLVRFIARRRVIRGICRAGSRLLTSRRMMRRCRRPRLTGGAVHLRVIRVRGTLVRG